MLYKLLLSFFLCGIGGWTFAQDTIPQAQGEDSYERAYQERIKQEMLNGVYIPRDLPDAFIQLNRLIDKKSRDKFKKMPEEKASANLRLFGLWMIHNWSFYEGSRLSKSVCDMGICHPEDMAEFIIIAYHRSVNRNALNIKSLIEGYKKKYERQKAERLKQGEVIHEEKRKRSND